MALLISVLEQGLIYAIMAFGIYITYKILDFPDLTVDGSFPMGAAIAAALISRDVNPLLTLPICFLLGAVVGTLTGLIHVKLKVRDLLSENFFSIANVDMTIMAQRPRIGPHIEAMRENIAEVLGIGKSRINIKATTTERLGFVGREEGIAAEAICSIYR